MDQWKMNAGIRSQINYLAYDNGLNNFRSSYDIAANIHQTTYGIWSTMLPKLTW